MNKIFTALWVRPWMALAATVWLLAVGIGYIGAGRQGALAVAK